VCFGEVIVADDGEVEGGVEASGGETNVYVGEVMGNACTWVVGEAELGRRWRVGKRVRRRVILSVFANGSGRGWGLG